jgi:hypothetical protein
MSKVKRAGHLCRLTVENFSDVRWWMAAVYHMVGVPLHSATGGRPVIQATHSSSDACLVGAGGFFNGSGWSALFSSRHDHLDINIKELLAIYWHLLRVSAQCRHHTLHHGTDNTQALNWLLRWRARPPEALTIIKSIWHLCNEFDIDLQPVFIPGKHNQLADAQSRSDWASYQSHLHTWLFSHEIC